MVRQCLFFDKNLTDVILILEPNSFKKVYKSIQGPSKGFSALLDIYFLKTFKYHKLQFLGFRIPCKIGNRFIVNRNVSHFCR